MARNLFHIRHWRYPSVFLVCGSGSARFSLVPSTSARFSLARFHFGAFLFGAFPNFVSKFMHSRVFVSFLRVFSAKKCCLCQFAAKPLYYMLSFAYHFLRVFTLCVIYLCFFVFGP